jgi:hypothetical protein
MGSMDIVRGYAMLAIEFQPCFLFLTTIEEIAMAKGKSKPKKEKKKIKVALKKKK